MSRLFLLLCFLILPFVTHGEDNPNLTKSFPNDYVGEDNQENYSSFDSRFEKVFGQKESLCASGFELATAALDAISTGDWIFSSGRGPLFRCESRDPKVNVSGNPCGRKFKLIRSTKDCQNADRPFSYYECAAKSFAWKNYEGDPCPKGYHREPPANDQTGAAPEGG